ncbi:MAG: enoyl-CoA hydratase/carnithine racemase [Bacteriovoracaceae bacterium]|jgi:enoyl-CoA hydratase/carnithine racemase
MSQFKSSTDLELIQKDEVLFIYLNRPEAMNAFSDEMINSLVDALERAEKDKSVRLSVISGRGKAFCAGGDLKAMEEKSGMFAGDSAELKKRYEEGIQRIPLTIESCQKPIIAMVNGAAIGAGLDLACMCDLRVGSTFSKYGETFAKLALVPGDGGSYFLQRVVGFAKAMEMTLTGRIYDANEALSMGLINKLSTPEELEADVAEFIKAILLTAPQAVSMGKEALKRAYHDEVPKMLDMLSTFQGQTQRTKDHFEAIAAFKEKRKPQWIGE